jgi:hypothetical protein
MKKIYLSVLSLAIAVGANAQGEIGPVSSKHHKGSPYQTISAKPSVSEAKATVLWSDDFSIPGNWTMTNTSAPVTWDWYIETNVTAIPTGPTVAAWLNPFISATASNGYALINSDGQPGNGDGNGAIVAEMTNATPIDLSLNPNVILRFQHSYRWWHEDRGVRVSGDNGVTWTDYPITDDGIIFPNGYPNDQNSAAIEYESINITLPAGGQSQVLIQFYYNDNDIWAWWWAVDDVEIISQPLDDISLVSAYVSGAGNGGIEYGRTPLNHVDASYFVGAEVHNFGVNDQANLILDASFAGAGTFTSQSLAPLLQADSTIFMESPETPTLVVGVYTGDYVVVSDDEVGGAEFADNSSQRVFEVTTDIYGIDGIGNNPAALEQLSTIGSASFTDGEDGLVVTSLYTLKATDYVLGMRVMLAAGTVEGGDIYGSIKDTTTFLAADMSSIFATNAHTVTAADIAQGYADVLFSQVESLPAGAYFAAVELYSNTNANDIVIIDDQTVAQPFYGSMIYVNGAADPGPFSNGTAVGIRLLMDPTAGIDENTLTGVSISPNPSNGIMTISTSSNVESGIAVYDMIGNVVHTSNMNAETTVDLSTLGAGVYLVKISNENGSAVERVVIK